MVPHLPHPLEGVGHQLDFGAAVDVQHHRIFDACNDKLDRFLNGNIFVARYDEAKTFGRKGNRSFGKNLKKSKAPATH